MYCPLKLSFSSVIILASCGSKLRRIMFKLTLVELIRETERVPHTQTTTQEIQAPSINQLNTLDSRHNKHWLLEGKRTRYRVSSSTNKVRRTIFKCPECNVGLFGTPHFEVDCVWNVMAHAQKPDFVFRRNGRVHLNRRGCQVSQLLAAELCASAVLMLDTRCF
jgi:hypothetical protein